MLNLQQLQFLMTLLTNPNSTVSILQAKICASTMDELETQLTVASKAPAPAPVETVK